jgi:hypothetical protein
LNYLGIDQIAKLPVNFVAKDLFVHPDLIGCYSCTTGLIASVKQVLHKLLYILGVQDLTAWGFEYRVTK